MATITFPNLDGQTTVDDFIKAYRESLIKQYGANRALIDNSKPD